VPNSIYRTLLLRRSKLETPITWYNDILSFFFHSVLRWSIVVSIIRRQSCRIVAFLQAVTHSLTAVLDQLRVVASSTSNDPGPRPGQHQQIGQCLLPLAAANFSVDDPAGASSQQREECRCGLLLTVAVPAKQVCSPVGDRCDQNDVCQQ